MGENEIKKIPKLANLIKITSDVKAATTPKAAIHEAKTHEAVAKFTRLRFEKLKDWKICKAVFCS